MERAYSILEKSNEDDDEKFYRIKGIASTPTPDRMRDIVDPMGAVFTTPMPLLWQHRHDKPVGNVTFAKPSKKGIPFEAEIPKVMESGAVKDRVEEAVHSLKYNLVNAVSIGFRSIKHNYLDDGGIEFIEWEWTELSLVTIPAQPEARIESIKSLDRLALAATGIKNAETPYYRKKKATTGIKRPIQIIKRTKP